MPTAMFKLIYRQLVYEPFRTLLTGGAIASALAVILLLAVIGAYLPYRLIAKLDSAIVFRS